MDFPTGNQDRSVYMVVKYEGLGSGGFGFGHSLENSAFGLSINRNGKLRINAYGQNDVVSDVTGTDAGWLVQGATLSDGQLVHSVNGVEIDRAKQTYATTHGGSRIVTSANQYGEMVLGADLDLAPSLDMQVAALFVYDRALDEAEQSKLQNYLQNKYISNATVSEKPFVQADAASVTQAGSVNISILGNDQRGMSVDPRTILIKSAANSGTLFVNANGTVRYTNTTPAFVDSFSYTVKSILGEESLPVSVDISIVNPVNPLPQTGLIAHFEADYRVETDSSGTIELWYDQSPQQNVFFGVKEGARFGNGDPKLIQGALNGHAVIDLDGVQDVLVSGNDDFPQGNSDRTIFMVVNYQGYGSGGFGYGQSRNNKAFGLSINPRGDMRVNAYGVENDLVSNTAGTGAGWLVQSAWLRNGEIVHSVNGLEIDRATHKYSTNQHFYRDQEGNAVPYAAGYGPLVLGADLDRSPAVDMQVAALLIYDRALLPAELSLVQNYLQNKYFGAGL